MHGNGDVDAQRAGFVGNQGAEGLLVERGFAVEEDSHDSLLGNVLKGFSVCIIHYVYQKWKGNFGKMCYVKHVKKERGSGEPLPL